MLLLVLELWWLSKLNMIRPQGARSWLGNLEDITLPARRMPVSLRMLLAAIDTTRGILYRLEGGLGTDPLVSE